MTPTPKTAPHQAAGPNASAQASGPTRQQIEAALSVLRASGQYVVLSHLPSLWAQRQLEFTEASDVPARQQEPYNFTVAVVDSEATDNKPESAGLIQLACVKLKVNASTLKSRRAAPALTSWLNMYHDPGIPSTPGAQAAHQIAPETIRGKRLNEKLLQRFLADVDVVVAHNADFDRRLIERHTSVFDHLPWACSMSDVPWKEFGVTSRSLEFLLFKAGHVHNAHDALNDCQALAAVLSRTLLEEPKQPGQEDNADPSGWDWLLWKCQRNSRRIVASAAPFAAKDALKERGYHWHDGTGDKLPTKAWVSPAIDESDVADEMRWLMNAAYGGNRNASVFVLDDEAQHRYSRRQNEMGWQSRAQIRLADVVVR